jgi:hypothetical protein
MEDIAKAQVRREQPHIIHSDYDMRQANTKDGLCIKLPEYGVCCQSQEMKSKYTL